MLSNRPAVITALLEHCSIERRTSDSYLRKEKNPTNYLFYWEMQYQSVYAGSGPVKGALLLSSLNLVPSNLES